MSICKLSNTELEAIIVELAKAYDPKLVDDRWYADWLEYNRFESTPGEGES